MPQRETLDASIIPGFDAQSFDSVLLAVWCDTFT